MANGSTFIDGVLRVNGYRMSGPNDDGVRTFTREVTSLRTMGTYVLTITDPVEGNPTITVSRKDNEHIVGHKTDTWVEIGSDAVLMISMLGG